jgi:branched-chain amino acid transport system permease protein
VWLATLVTLGIRSNVAALTAGLSATLLAGVVSYYLPISFGNVTPILFGLGAIGVAKFPNGIMTENARQVRWAWDKLRSASISKGAPDPEDPPATTGARGLARPGAPARSFAATRTEI